MSTNTMARKRSRLRIRLIQKWRRMKAKINPQTVEYIDAAASWGALIGALYFGFSFA